MEIGLCSDSTYIIGESLDYYKLLLKQSQKNRLIDRLFRRYVKEEDVLATIESLKKLPKNELTDKLIEAFIYRTKTAEYCFKESGKYMPIRIICTDTVYWLIEKNISLEDYDNLEGDPLWMRPEYMLEKYCKNFIKL